MLILIGVVIGFVQSAALPSGPRFHQFLGRRAARDRRQSGGGLRQCRVACGPADRLAGGGGWAAIPLSARLPAAADPVRLAAVRCWHGGLGLRRLSGSTSQRSNACFPDCGWLPAAFPPVFVAAVIGQNSFLMAALLIGGLVLMRTRPFIAGLVLGCLILKPQMALLLPVAVLAARQWRTMFGAALSSVGLLLLGVAIFGLAATQRLDRPDAALCLDRARRAGRLEQACQRLCRCAPGRASTLDWR